MDSVQCFRITTDRIIFLNDKNLIIKILLSPVSRVQFSEVHIRDSSECSLHDAPLFAGGGLVQERLRS